MSDIYLKYCFKVKLFLAVLYGTVAKVDGKSRNMVSDGIFVECAHLKHANRRSAMMNHVVNFYYVVHFDEK